MEELIKVCIHSVPRSGSTWLGALFDSNENVAYRFQPLFSYSHKDRLNPKSSSRDIQLFFEEIMNTKDDFVLQKSKDRATLKPYFKKFDNPSHLIYKEVRYHNILENLITKSNTKAIGLIRNPFSVISSWLIAPKEFRMDLGWKIKDEWRFAPLKNLSKPEEFNGYEKWKEVCFLFLRLQHAYPNQFYLISYDDLLSNTIEQVKLLFKFCDLEYTTQTDEFIKESTSSQSNDAYAIFKQKTNDLGWKKTLPDFIENAIKEDDDFRILNQHFKWI